MHVSVGYSRRNWRCNQNVTQSLTQLHVAQICNILYEKSNKIPIGTPDKENTSGKTQKNGTEKSEIVVR